MKRIRTISVVMLFLIAVAAVATGCSANSAGSEGAAPGRVWEPSQSGLPTFYVFSDPS